MKLIKNGGNEMNEQNLKLETIKNHCKESAKVISVLQIFAIIGIVGALVGVISCFTMKDTINSAIAKEVASGNLNIENFRFGGGIFTFKINYDEAFKSGDYATPLIINCVAAVIITSACLYLLSAFKKIFKNLIKEDNPFSDSILSSLKICIIVITVILVAFVGIGPGVIVGLLCRCIYSILEYGKLLQTEVDEIL